MDLWLLCGVSVRFSIKQKPSRGFYWQITIKKYMKKNKQQAQTLRIRLDEVG